MLPRAHTACSFTCAHVHTDSRTYQHTAAANPTLLTYVIVVVRNEIAEVWDRAGLHHHASVR